MSIENFFYDIKNYRYLSELEIEEIRKTFNELEKSLNLKRPRYNIDSVYHEDLSEDEYLDEYADEDKHAKIGSVRRLFKGFDCDYYKPIGFDEKYNNYIKYRSNGDKHENLSPEEYLNMIRPYLRGLINKHKPIVELNNNNNNNNNSNNNNNNNDTYGGNWKIQLSMIISCISTRRQMHYTLKK